MTQIAEPSTTDSGPHLPAAAAPAPRRRGGVWAVAAAIGVCAAVGGGWWLWRLAHSEVRRPERSAAEVEQVAPPPPFVAALETHFETAKPIADQPEPPSTPLVAMVDRIARLSASLSAEAARQAAESAVVLPGRQAKPQSEDEVRHERWELRFAADSTLESYARQLDFFGIELGVLGGKDEVIYLSHLSDHEPTQHAGAATGEGRLYLTWQRGGLAEADRKFAQRAKINTKGKVLALFCPARVEKELAELERVEAKRRKLDSVHKTVFGILPEGQTFKFYVIEQQAGSDAAAQP